MHHSTSDNFIVKTIHCRHENVSQKRLHLFMHSKEDQPVIYVYALSTELLLTNYFLMQQCTPDRSAVCCAGNIWVFTVQGSFQSALKKNSQLYVAQFSATYWHSDTGNLYLEQFPRSFFHRKKSWQTVSHILSLTRQWLPVNATLHCQVSSYVLIPAARQKINEWGLSL